MNGMNSTKTSGAIIQIPITTPSSGNGTGNPEVGLKIGEKKNFRGGQDSNLRSQRESDFESDALTTRPRLLTPSP